MFDEIRNAIETVKGNPEALAKEIHGIDVSAWQRNIDWKAIGKSQSFVYLKGTEGRGFRDRAFESHSQGAISSGRPFGYYHFARPSHGIEDARHEAQDFCAALDVHREHWTLPPVLDLEMNEHNFSRMQMVDWCMAFIEVVESSFNRPVMVYGSPGMLDSFLPHHHPMGSRPLWVAHYGTHSPRIPRGWEKIDVWQYADQGYRVPGYDGDIDVNKSKVEFLYKCMRPNSQA